MMKLPDDRRVDVLVVLAVLLAVVACEQTFLAPDAERFDPPERFRAMTSSVDRCLRNDFAVFRGFRPFGELIWYEGTPQSGGDGTDGEYIGKGRIVLRDGPDATPFVVSHELIHDRTQAGHEHAAFGPEDGYESHAPWSTCERDRWPG